MTTTTQPEETTTPPSTALHPLRWMKENLFSSWWNTVLTFVVAAGIVGALVGILNFVFAPERQWNSVFSNTRLYATFAYPEADYWRVWVSLGIVVILTGLSLAAWAGRPRVAASRLIRASGITGAIILLVSALAPVSGGIRIMSTIG